jgi:hypothetical protein
VSETFRRPKRLLVELLRVQPREAEVIAARLRSAGIDVSLGGDPIYESVSFADGVAVLVAKGDRAEAVRILAEPTASA